MAIESAAPTGALSSASSTHPTAANIATAALNGTALGFVGGGIGSFAAQVAGGGSRGALIGRWVGRIGLGAVGALAGASRGAAILERQDVGARARKPLGDAVGSGALGGAALGAAALSGGFALAEGAGSALMGHRPLVVAGNAARLGGQWAVAGAIAGAAGGALGGLVLEDPTAVVDTTVDEAGRSARATVTTPTSYILPGIVGLIAGGTGTLGAMVRAGNPKLSGRALGIGALRGVGAAAGAIVGLTALSGAFAGVSGGLATAAGAPRR